MTKPLTEADLCRRYASTKFYFLPTEKQEKMEEICEGFRQKLIRKGQPNIALHLSDEDLLEVFIKIGSRIQETERN